MKRNQHAALGAMHPIFFFVLVYSIALFLALFVCRTVFYSIYSKDDIGAIKVASPSSKNTVVQQAALTAAVYK